MEEKKCPLEELEKKLAKELFKAIKESYNPEKPQKIPDNAARTELNRHESEYITKLSKLISFINSFYEKFDIVDGLIESEKFDQLQEILLEISNCCLIEIGRYYNDCITHD